MITIQLEYVYFRAENGASIDACLKEALVFCLEENVSAIVLHNDREYPIDPDKLVRMFFKQVDADRIVRDRQREQERIAI